MKKTLLATAIAGAMVVSASASAATVYNQDGTKLDLYGNIQIAYYSTEENLADAGDPLDVQTQDGITDNGTTFGFAAEHAISSDLTGYLKLEFDDIKADEMATAVDNEDSGDTAYVGLKGSFGDVRLGSYDQLIDDWIQDPITNNEGFDVSDSTGEHGEGGDQQTDKVTYTSPSFNGLQFAVGTQYKGDFDSEDGANDTSDSGSNASFFGGAKYTVGAFSLAAAYDDLDNVVDANGDSVGDQYGLTAQYTLGALRLAAKYETFDAEADDSDVDFAALSARTSYGMGDVYGAVQEVSRDAAGADDSTEVIVGANYNISSAMYTWVEVATYDAAEDEGDGVGVGVTYLF